MCGPEVHLSQQLGANRRFIVPYVPQIGSHVPEEIESVIGENLQGPWAPRARGPDRAPFGEYPAGRDAAREGRGTMLVTTVKPKSSHQHRSGLPMSQSARASPVSGFRNLHMGVRGEFC